MTKTIMIVDDSATMLMSLQSTLELIGFEVVSAADGEIALDKLKNSPKPDLIITDINMPKMDGIELIRQTRSLPGFRFTPILVLTTESQQTKREEAKQLGATGWLIKPIGGENLHKVIKQVLPGA
ncbi:response regulator [Candidatus Methylospira mobilis]|uniref:Response regulator n=1 Tax=Candidatus Methylospira mobilis TaxID=1808979 RepID=A0A5Q0BGG7_9GAMM|nr:response regulator [Candidatus Methylospira mobilis]QFY42900.1 response regulator [Candidatus Methylospira mobilis]WNV04041.1 response regulator [Candidatus Methylospira mobilis]